MLKHVGMSGERQREIGGWGVGKGPAHLNVMNFSEVPEEVTANADKVKFIKTGKRYLTN
jgi:hypothetical protein